MKSVFTLVALVASLAFFASPAEASDGQDVYASYWTCSDGNTYGLTANGSKRALYLPTGRAPLFFSGVKRGNTYTGTVYVGGQSIPVSGPVTNNSTRVTLRSNTGQTWVLNYSHK